MKSASELPNVYVIKFDFPTTVSSSCVMDGQSYDVCSWEIL